MTRTRTLILGNSDGIGLALSRLLLADGHEVTGLSRSPAPIEHESYRHHVVDVRSEAFPLLLQTLLAADEPWHQVIYCVGVGNPEEKEWWRGEVQVIETNFVACVKTLEQVLPHWLEAKSGGHFVALSSLADALHVQDAASYCSSKAGLSRYLESAGLRLRSEGIFVTNLRFGFVDTKMAQSPVKPFMVTPEKAALVMRRVLRRKPLRSSYPWRAWALVSALQWLTRPLVLWR